MAKREIEITIDLDGTVHLDAMNFDGKACDATLEKFRKELGRLKKSTKKPEYYRRKDRESQRERD